MTSFPGSPRLLKGGIVLIDADTGVVQRIIALQYNPDTLSPTLQVQGVGNESGDRSSSPRFTLKHLLQWQDERLGFCYSVDS
jgi:hypothetical protein